MFSTTRPSDFVRRSLALTAILSAGVLVAGAQTSAGMQPGGSSVSAAPAFNLQAPAVDTSKDALYSSSASSSDSDFLASNAAPATFENAMQYGGGGRYGRPRYRGGNSNQDGSSKYTFYAGGGITLPVSTTNSTNTPNWGLQVGAGRNFNRHFGVNLEFDYDTFGLTGASISDYIYVNTGTTDNSAYQIDANMHVWNFSLQPVYNLYSGEGLGAYITGGVGFYHKVTNFTQPTESGYCDPYYGCYAYTANATFDHYTSNAVGADGGIGLTYKFSRFSNERLYAEARYVYVANQYKPGATDANATTYNGYNYYPANSNTTTYFPVKFGIRF